MSSFIRAFQVVPKELFRLNNGPTIALRERTTLRTRSYDLLTEANKVKPKALNPSTYSAPNGASMRPNTLFQRHLVQNFKGKDTVIFSVPADTRLPDDLVLVHEHTDHYSLQPAVEMTVPELNTKITAFLNAHAKAMTRDEWLQLYPTPTETS